MTIELTMFWWMTVEVTILHVQMKRLKALSRDDLLIQPFHLTEDDYYYDDGDYFC